MRAPNGGVAIRMQSRGSGIAARPERTKRIYHAARAASSPDVARTPVGDGWLREADASGRVREQPSEACHALRTVRVTRHLGHAHRIMVVLCTTTPPHAPAPVVLVMLGAQMAPMAAAAREILSWRHVDRTRPPDPVWPARPYRRLIVRYIDALCPPATPRLHPRCRRGAGRADVSLVLAAARCREQRTALAAGQPARRAGQLACRRVSL